MGQGVSGASWLAGAVLAGGASTRMGCDKASLRLPDGTTWLENAWQLVTALGRPCWVACGSRPRPGYACLPDARAGLGPAAGVVAALVAARAAGARALLVVPCDAPRMRSDLLARLVKAAPEAGMGASQKGGALATVFRSPRGMPEMLVGVYRVAALPVLEAGLKAGERALHRLVPPERRIHVPYCPDEAPCFLNANTPAEAASFARLPETFGNF